LCETGAEIIPSLPWINKNDFDLVKKIKSGDLILPVSIKSTETKGNGLFSTRKILKKELICLYAGILNTIKATL
jgi:hypothetical protein